MFCLIVANILTFLFQNVIPADKLCEKCYSIICSRWA